MTSLEDPPAQAAPARTLTIASVPAGHVYIRHLTPLDGTGPVRLPDPHPEDARRTANERWWPPVMLDPDWVRDHDFDLMHLHFGFDAAQPDDLARLVRTLDEMDRPLVYTVHDLRNPHHDDRAAHDAALDVLIPAAAGIITLTHGAADEIHRRWGRDAVVLPHPHVVPLPELARRRRARAVVEQHDARPFRVGLHVKSLRANMAPMRILPTLVDTVADLPGAELQVNIHHDVMDAAGARHEAGLADYLSAQARRGALDLVVHDYLSDDDLWSYLAALDVSVLPYRFGTHSGWLEACRDLGTTVVAPDCGYFSQQGPVIPYHHRDDRFDAGSLSRALRLAHHERPDLGVTEDERRAQRRSIAVSHDLIYRSVLSERR